jgi:CBS domain containing-hemolysin-like protein
MSDKKSEKSAYDYAELGGLRISLMNLKLKAGDKVVIDWLELRIKELNNL